MEKDLQACIGERPTTLSKKISYTIWVPKYQQNVPKDTSQYVLEMDNKVKVRTKRSKKKNTRKKKTM